MDSFVILLFHGSVQSRVDRFCVLKVLQKAHFTDAFLFAAIKLENTTSMSEDPVKLLLGI